MICGVCGGSGINRHSGHACDRCDGTGWIDWMDVLTPWVIVLLIAGAGLTLGQWLWNLLHK